MKPNLFGNEMMLAPPIDWVYLNKSMHHPKTDENNDYISYITRTVPIFTYEIKSEPPIPIIRQSDIAYMHYKTLAIFILLHKMNVRPVKT